MPNDLLKDLMELGGLSNFGLSFSVECDNCEHYGDITEEQRNSDTIYPAEQKKTCQNNWDGCKDATLRYIAKKLTELGYVKVTRCGECGYWRESKERKGTGYCRWFANPGVSCYKDFYCCQGEPKEAN